MAFRLSTAARNAACNAIVDLVDGGASAGTIVIRSGAQPTNPQTAATGTTLATLTFHATNDAFGAASSGQATADTITSDTSVIGGTAGWARVYDSDGVDPDDAIFDMDVGENTGTLDFDETLFVTGGTAAITSMTITVPES